MEIINVTPEQWLNMLNEEAHPKKDTYKLNYYQCADEVFVYLKTDIGTYISPSYNIVGKSKEEIENKLKILTTSVENENKAQKEKINVSNIKDFIKIF